jgi:hypothetical protein
MASDDPEFAEKAAEIIGWYLKPPMHAAEAVLGFLGLIQQWQISAENLTGVGIERQIAVDDPIIELVFVCRHDDDVKFPGRSMHWTTRLGISVLIQSSFFDVLGDFAHRPPIGIAHQNRDRPAAGLLFRKQGGLSDVRSKEQYSCDSSEWLHL